jgi:hypothetical protein
MKWLDLTLMITWMYIGLAKIVPPGRRWSNGV